MSGATFDLSFCFLSLLLISTVLRGIIGGRTIFEFPTIYAMMGLVWVVPQGIVLESHPNDIYSNEQFWAYVSLCFICIFLGFYLGKRAQERQIRKTSATELRKYDGKRLLFAAAGLTAVGLIANLMMRGVDTSEMGGQWTGVITFYYLLAKVNGFGLCLAVLIFSRTRSPIAAVIAIVAAVPIFQAAVFFIRREEIFDLIILTAGAWYLSQGRHPPRAAVVVAVFVGTVILNSAGNLRTYVNTGDGTLTSALVSVETYTNFDYFAIDQANASEIAQAQYDFAYVNQTGEFEYGADHWNKLIHQYVPAFLLGREFKEALKIPTLSERLRRGEEQGQFSLGSTRTGFSDSYRAFGVFGASIFLLIGYGFGLLYARADWLGIEGQFFYLILLAEGLKSMTHSTAEFFSSLPFTLIVSLFAFYFARARSYRRVSP